MRRRLAAWVAAATVATGLAGAANRLPEGTVVLDDFETITGWLPHPADGVALAIGSGEGSRGRALRLDFHFTGGGYAVARKDLDVALPENYAFSFRVRGEAPSNHLEFKLIDATGENVWWSVRRDLEFSSDWETFTIKKRHISFAWGPIGGGDIRDVAAIEFVITSGSGGAGTVWIDELELRALPSRSAAPRPILASASSMRGGHDPAYAIDGDPATSWAPDPEDSVATLTLDFQQTREYGGLILDWALDRSAQNYDLEASLDGESWRTLRRVRDGNGGRDYLMLPESESSGLRLRLLSDGVSHSGALSEIAIQPLEWGATREAFFEAVASEAPRGSFPKGIAGETTFWTVVGIDADEREVLFGQEGAIETGKGRFSVEPFLFVDGSLASWSDAHIEHSLADGYLPVPSVTWKLGHGTGDETNLKITAFGTGQPGASSAVVRYRVQNRGAARVSGTLFLALRPFQVNPPWQFLNARGGFAPIPEILRAGDVVRVPGQGTVVSLTPPDAFGAVAFDGGDIVVEYLRRGRVPPTENVVDPVAAASGALAYRLDLAPGSEQEVVLYIPLHDDSPRPEVKRASEAVLWAEHEQSRVEDSWRERLGRVSIELPESASWIAETVRSQLAYILINRAGPAIQPGTRSYARSWIRDGALTSWALLRLGQPDVAREFLEWYAPHQYENGKIPCVVDGRGADPVPEHDSSGEFIFLVAELYRHTRDRELAERMWPRVLAAVSYLDALRGERLTEEWRQPGREAFLGILPPSISHEGYSAKPMHSYWDDFFALRGFRDAVFLAGELGSPEGPRLEGIHREFERDLAASIEAAMRMHAIDYVPGCADLGDFDATSTTIALSPASAIRVAGRTAIERTFEKYWEFFRARRDGEPWDAYTPYEIRNVGAFVRLGWRERAHELLAFFRGHQRPRPWRQWAEVVWSDETEPRFLGDLPHTWVGSDFIRSILDLFAWEREEDDALVLAAGVPRQWLAGEGVAVRGLPTRHGLLGYAIREVNETIEMRIESGLEVPRGGLVISLPVANPSEVTLNGSRGPAGFAGEIVVRHVPVTIVVRP